MKKHFQRVKASERERGASMFLIAITVIIVLLSGAVAVDLSSVASRGQDLQNAVDSAALAGVQAYRESMGSDTVADATDEAAATQAVADLLEQNGVSGLTVSVDFPDTANFTEVQVAIQDDDPGTLLSGVTGITSSVERSATARFERCESDCVKAVEIPTPFSSVDARGDGDGYKPIPVGGNLYGLNHNATSLQIVCVSRRTQEPCWGAEGSSDVGRNAYAYGYQPPRNPEMLHTGVVGTKIYWTVSLSSGHYLYCFETLTDTPCALPFKINNLDRATELRSRVENRGSGTFAYNDNIYTFTDDHRIHCVTTGATMGNCPSYGSGRSTGLGEANFPAHRPEDGNHGSAIDRIIDEENGRVYHTLHIDTAVLELDCANPLQNPVGQEIIIENMATGEFLSRQNTDRVFISSDGDDGRDRWEVTETSGGALFFRSIHGNDYLSANGYSADLRVQSNNGNDQRWRLTSSDGVSHVIENFAMPSRTFITDSLTGDYFADETTTDQSSNPVQRWQFWPEQCGRNGFTSIGGVTPTLPLEVGTWLDCYDLVNHEPCFGFTPSKIHNDWDSFSGRLFFYRSSGAAPVILGVCSTGFTEHWEWSRNMGDKTELSCVDLSGDENTTLEDSMPLFLDALKATTDSANNWGTWGDPHYNDFTNRIFYPTHRTYSRVLCWDWDTGWCGQIQGVSQNGTTIQDYGFFSESNCVYGLGHNAVFYAFEAGNINEQCKGSSTTEPISPCNCGGSLYWGSLFFDVDIELFDSFYIEIKNDDGVRVYPAAVDRSDTTNEYYYGHDLHVHGDIIDLNHLPIESADQQLFVTVSVEAEGDPWAEGAQSFTIELERTPRLTD